MLDYTAMPKPPKRYKQRNRPKKTSAKTANERGYNYRWQLVSRQFLKLNPLCVMCKESGIVTAATDVDHILPHRGNKELFWDQSNWQPLCKSHHGKKSASEVQ